jgi:hypothetical protein
MVLRPNRVIENAASHMRKAKRAQAIWPKIVVMPWDPEEEPA